MSITIIELAKMVGVSKSTVSRALNGDPRVKEATQKKIKEIAL
ncbi:MAG: LacI family DNA-binding transcriptional regulator, partial [Spirochaetota bacterium]